MERDASRDLSPAFQRVMNLDGGAFERLVCYEAALWAADRADAVRAAYGGKPPLSVQK
jgi:hypothetical protein